MTDPPFNDNEPIPDDIRKALSDAGKLPDDVRRRFGYLREDFIEATRAAAEVGSVHAESALDAVFSLAGDLLRRLEGVIAGALPPQPALAGARSAQTARKPIATAARVFDDVRVELVSWRTGDRTELELNVVNQRDGSEVRPFEVTVTDGEGNELAPTLSVSATEQSPCFPDPTAGEYIFSVSWPGGVGGLRIGIE